MRVLAQTPVLKAWNGSGPVYRGFRNSSVLLAFILFAIVNFSYFCQAQSKMDRDGVIFALNRFRGEVQTVKCVILGSSVAKHVVESITSSERRQLHVGSLAYNLQMPSDSFILINQILNSPESENDCRQVVFCVTPRDFYDHDTGAIIDTTTFKRRISLPECFFYQSAFNLSTEERVKSIFSKFCPIFERRSSFQKRLSNSVNSLYEHFIGGQSAENKRLDSWNRSLAEYAWRYQGISISSVSPQLSILLKCTEICKRRGQSVIWVNLPLSGSNLELLPNGFYSQYRALLREKSKSSSVTLLDLSQMALSRADFEDCAHLNGQGGQKVFANIRPSLITRW